MAKRTRKEIHESIKAFLKHNGKVNWESEYENGELCIGEEKIREYIIALVDSILQA